MDEAAIGVVWMSCLAAFALTLIILAR